jgi:radical SAM superfamily enzyme YgiQ (UPF0313 family)
MAGFKPASAGMARAMDLDRSLHYTYFCYTLEAMKILLIQPPVEDFYQTSIRTQPLGLAYLAASLQRRNHDVEILDCRTAEKRSAPLPSELAYLSDFYPGQDRSPFKLYSGYFRFGMGPDEIRRNIENSGADLYGISSCFTPYHQQALEVAGIVKELDPGKIVVMGGAHVSCDPEGVLTSPLVDYVVLGEGEIRFPLLVEEIGKGGEGDPGGIDGVGFRQDGRAVVNPARGFVEDLDSVSPPARSLLDPDRYRIGKKRLAMFLTSRGCPHRCAYCSGHLVTGTGFRGRAPEAILQEMIESRERYGTEVFDIEDDNFTFDRDRAKTLMRRIIETFGERVLRLTAMNGVSFASLDGELLGLMRRAGFDAVNLSFVSADRGFRGKMGRPHASIDFDGILEEAERFGFQVTAYAILGIPGQTIEEMIETLIHLMGKRVLIGPSIYYPSPGTPLFEDCAKARILSPHPAQWRSSAFPIESGDFNRLDLATLFRITRIINFIKGKMDRSELKEGLTWKGFSEVLKTKAGEPKEALQGEGSSWIDLVARVVEERSFFGAGRNKRGGAAVWPLPTSRRVLNCFIERAWDRPIRKSRPSCFSPQKNAK